MDSKIKVYIVEDEALIANDIRETLEDLGYEVAGVSYDYDDALEKIKATDFDLLILDINLGDHVINTGLDIAQQLPQLKQVPFIFLTAFTDTDTILKASKLRPSAYLVKPTSASRLFAAIQTAIENFNTHHAASSPVEATSELDHFFCKTGKRIARVEWADVYAIVATKNYVKLLTPENPSGYLIRNSLQQTLTKIVPPAFQNSYTAISRNTLLRRDAIREVKPCSVVTDYGEFESNKSTGKLFLDT